MSANSTLISWLLENGGLSIRYRTATELLETPGSIDIGKLTHDLMDSQQVRLWLQRLTPAKGLNQLHSSQVTAYENAMGKLVQLGCRSGIAALDEKTRDFRNWLLPHRTPSEFDWTPFSRMIVGSFLVLAGYHQENAIQEYLSHRLETLWRFAREKDFEIYTDRAQYPDTPAGFRNKPLVKPELYVGGEERFPTIYDIHALANYPDRLMSANTQHKIDAVIEYILHPKYQAFPDGYGLMRAGKRKYYSMGWSVHLPGYQAEIENRFDDNRFIQRLVLMSNFAIARKHCWFHESIEHLENHRTEQGTYRFPRSYLQERSSGYWVTGAYMGLEENRRKKIAVELESTFWMLKLKKQLI